MDTIGARIKAKRKERGLSQAALGKILGVSNTAIVYWERDETAPKGKNLFGLANALGVSPVWLLRGGEDGGFFCSHRSNLLKKYKYSY